MEAVTLVDRDHHGVAELALSRGSPSPAGTGSAAKRSACASPGGRLHALGRDDVEMAAHVARVCG